MEDVAKDQCDVLIFTKTNNDTSGGVEYHLQLTDDHCRCTVQHCVAVVNSVSDKCSIECPLGIGRKRTPDAVYICLTSYRSTFIFTG